MKFDIYAFMMQVLAASDGHCVWYGECPVDGKTLNCYYNGPAKKLDDAHAADTLIELCPMLNLSRGKCCRINLWIVWQ